MITHEMNAIHNHRPVSVTLLCLLVLMIASFNLVRLIQAIATWEYLNTLLPTLPYYLAAAGLLWGLFCLVVCIGLWLGAKWAPTLVWVGCLVYIPYYWLNYLWISQPVGQSNNWIFILTLQLVVLILIYLLLTNPGTKMYFRRNP